MGSKVQWFNSFDGSTGSGVPFVHGVIELEGCIASKTQLVQLVQGIKCFKGLICSRVQMVQ